MRSPKIGVVTLGCPKNATDTEVMLGLLNEAGFSVTFDNDEADMCLVNTCAFIALSRQESVKALVDLASQGKELIIAGCLAQHYKSELLAELPEARAVVGTGDITKIVDVIKSVAHDPSVRVMAVSDDPNYRQEDLLPRMQTGVGGYAYLKIAEGCDHRCTFCIIPSLRGDFRSRTIESLVKEARILVASGVREIILVSQDSTYYGIDIYGRQALIDLIESLHEIPDLDWIRIMYFYPTEASDLLLEAINRLPKVVKYIDIPLQHSHPEILSRMARPLHPERVISRIRQLIPQAAIRSTFIVGFPGETEEHLEHLAQFIIEHQFNRLGVFTYSRQMEVPSGHMEGQVPERIKRQRRKRIMEIQHAISTKLNQNLIGQTIDVLIEGYDQSKGLFFGRSQWDAPEIDHQVYLPGDNAIVIGDIVQARVTKAKPYDLFAQVV